MLQRRRVMLAEEHRTRLIGEIAKVLREECVPDDARAAGLVLIGWLARRMPGETAHALGVEEMRAACAAHRGASGEPSASGSLSRDGSGDSPPASPGRTAARTSRPAVAEAFARSSGARTSRAFSPECRAARGHVIPKSTMADRAVDLPKPHPDDDEDVVDWLSTARALWARGERADALVWLRRAAEAAAMAGQPFRASEIGMYVTALEETFGDLPARPEPAPKRGSDRAPQDTLVDSNEAFGALASEVLRSKLTSIEVDIEEDTLIEEEPAGLAEKAPEVASAAPKAPPPPPPLAPKPQAPVAAHEPKIIVQVASVPPPAPATSPPITAPSSQPPAALAGSGSAPPPPAVARPASVAPPPSFIPPMVAPRTPDGEEITLVSASLPVGAFRHAAGSTVPFGASPLAGTPMPPPARVAPAACPRRRRASGCRRWPCPRRRPRRRGTASVCARAAASAPRPARAPRQAAEASRPRARRRRRPRRPARGRRRPRPLPARRRRLRARRCLRRRASVLRRARAA